MTKPQLVLKERSDDAEGNIGRARAVGVALTGNVNFPTPSITLAALDAAADAAQLALDKCNDKNTRSHNDVLDKNNKTLILHNLLRSELNYCQQTAEATYVTDYITMRTVLEGCGYELKADKHAQGISEAVRNLHVFKSPELNDNQAGVAWDEPANITSKDNISIYEIYKAPSNDFTLATIIGSVKKTTYIYTNDTNAVQNIVLWIVPKTTAGEGVRSAPLAIKVLGI